MRQFISIEFDSDKPVPADALRLLIAGFLYEEVGVLQDSVSVSSAEDSLGGELVLPDLSELSAN